jgi:3-phosphoshikimate 1-carboxyvinyltransferase
MYYVQCTLYETHNRLYIVHCTFLIPSPEIFSVQTVIKRGNVKGVIAVPSSKSILQRYLIAALLSEHVTELHAISHCSDTLSCLDAVQKFGAKVIESKPDFLKIKGQGKNIRPVAREINCGESGFALRALSAIAALSDTEIQLTGNGSLLNRPLGFMEDVFMQLGVKSKFTEGKLPVTLQGPVRFTDVVTDGSLSSQFISGLLMVFPFAGEEHIIEVRDLKSRQYIDLTLEVLQQFGIEITNEDYKGFIVQGNQKYKACNVNVEGDWSAASCMLVAGAIAGEVTVKNLSLKSSQPDKIILDVLKKVGAEIVIDANNITAGKPQRGKLKSFVFNATDCPDIFPALAVLATQCDGVSEITGVDRLLFKESNRALALQQEFSKLCNGIISIEGNIMKIKGENLKGALVHSHHDHRIAMALAVAGLCAEGNTVIDDSGAVSKSYPEFFNDLSGIISHE